MRSRVATVGELPQGVPTPSVPWTSWSDVVPLLIGAVGITLVSLTDTIATSSSFATRRGEEVDADQEMVGIGTANVAAGLFGWRAKIPWKQGIDALCAETVR